MNSIMEPPRAVCCRCKGSYSVNEFLSDLRLCQNCRRAYIQIERQDGVLFQPAAKALERVVDCR